MVPTVCLVRHAQGENNIDNSHWKHDAVLTDQGKVQAEQLKQLFPYHDQITAVISSPLRRAMQTASLAFAPALRRPDIKFVLNPLAQESNAYQCDIGHDTDKLRALLPDLMPYSDLGFSFDKIDVGLVEDGWNSKTGIYSPDRATVTKRAAELRKWLYKRPEDMVILVTHGAFLHFLTEDWTGDDAIRGTGYLNCEVRKFTFTKESTGEEAHLEELEENKAARIKIPGTV